MEIMKSKFATESIMRQWFCTYFRAQKGMATPIETKTVVGVPDLHVVSAAGWEKWYEFKIKHCNYGVGLKYKIDFRPGQQKWALQYRALTGKDVICVVQFNNGVYYFPIMKLWNDNKIEHDFFSPFYD